MAITLSLVLWELHFPAGFGLVLFGVPDGTLKSNANLVGNLLWWTPCKDQDSSSVCLLGHNKDFWKGEGKQ